MRSLEEVEVMLKVAIGILVLMLMFVSWLAFARHPSAASLRSALLATV